MKRMKKILAMLLAVVMVMGLSVTVFAEDLDLSTEPTGSHITVNNLPPSSELASKGNVRLTWKQIVVPNREVEAGWSLATGVTGIDLEQLIKIGGGNENAAAGLINNAEVLKAIKGLATDGDTGVTTTGTAYIPVTEPGLYVVEAVAEGWDFIPMLAFVDYNDDKTGATNNTNLHAKGEKLQVGKEITDGTITVTSGDIVPFKVTASYPYFDANDTTKTFTITDTVTGGKIVANSVVVKVIGAGAEGADVTLEDISEVKDENQLTVNIVTGNDDYVATYAGKQVEITYNVEVVLNETINKLTNEVESSVSGVNDPTKAKVECPSVTAVVLKTDEDTNAGLNGAEFTLYVVTTKENEATHKLLEDNTIVTKETEGESTTLLKEVKTEATKDVKLSDTDAEATKGVAKFINMDPQKTYYVVETKAPQGYSLDVVAKQLTVTTPTEGTPTLENGVMVTRNEATNFNNLTVTDTTLASLPSTGGIGTTIFTIGGCAIMIVAAGLFFVSRRKASK